MLVMLGCFAACCAAGIFPLVECLRRNIYVKRTHWSRWLNWLKNIGWYKTPVLASKRLNVFSGTGVRLAALLAGRGLRRQAGHPFR